MPEYEELIYSYDEFHKDCAKIAAWARDKNFQSVYGIPTGGLMLAVELHNLLGIPLLLHKEDITKHTLIVDDILHKGGTIGRLFGVIGTGYKVATLFLNIKEAKIRPDFFVRETEMWVRFPWETAVSSRYDGTL